MKSLKIQCVGYEIAADWYQGHKNEMVLVLPGYMSSKEHYEPLILALHQKTDMSFLVIDYTGHGKSPFYLPDLSPAQNFLEVVTAFDWLTKNHPNKKIIVLGTSYGGFLAAQLTKYRKFDRLVLRVPAIYKPEDFYTKWRIIDRHHTQDNFRKDAEALSRHPLLLRAMNFKGKTLVIVHEHDEAVPKQTTDAYIKAFKAETYLAKGFSHSFSAHLNKPDKITAYQDHLARWLNG